MRKEFTEYDVWGFHKVESDRWNWRRSSPEGEVLLEGSNPFPTFDDCMADARRHGYIGSFSVAT